MSHSSILKEIPPTLWVRLFAKVLEHFVYRDQLTEAELTGVPSVVCNSNPLAVMYYLSRIDAQILIYEQFSKPIQVAVAFAGTEYNRPDLGPCPENEENLALQVLGLVVKQYWHNDEDEGKVYESCQHTILGSIVIPFFDNLLRMSEDKISAMYSARDELHQKMLGNMAQISDNDSKIILPH